MHGSNYRQVKSMAYTSKKFAPGAPQLKIAKFTGGAGKPDYELLVSLVTQVRAQIRHNALEAARVSLNRVMAEIGETEFFSLLKIYPHIILRENKMIATAGADRLQEGMRRAFGKPVGLAAKVKVGDTIMELRIKKANLDIARKAMKRASSKLPVKTSLVITDIVR